MSLRAIVGRWFLRHFVVPKLGRVRGIPVQTLPENWEYVSTRMRYVFDLAERVSPKAMHRLQNHLLMVTVSSGVGDIRYFGGIRSLFVSPTSLHVLPEKRLAQGLLVAATLVYLETRFGTHNTSRQMTIARKVAEQALDKVPW